MNDCQETDWSPELFHWLATERLGLIPSQSSQRSIDFWTQEYLETKIAANIHERGKCVISQVQEGLGVELSIIQRALPRVLALDARLMERSQVLFTKQFLLDTARQWQTLIDDRGSITLNELGLEWNLPQDVIQEILLTDFLHAIVDPKDKRVLYSPKLLENGKKDLLGAMENAESPILLSKFPIYSHGYLFHICLEELSEARKALGIIKGLYFLPKKYTLQALKDMEIEFAEKGFIDYKIWRDHFVDDPRQVIESKFPQCICLSEIVLHPNWRKDLVQILNQEIQSTGWVELSSHVPLKSLSQPDFQVLIKELKFGASSSELIDYPCIMAVGFLGALKQSLEPTVHHWYTSQREQASRKKESHRVPIMSEGELSSIIANLGLGFPDHLVSILSRSILKHVNEVLINRANSVFVSRPVGTKDPRYLSLKAASRDQWILLFLFYKGLSHLKGQRNFTEIVQYLFETKVEEFCHTLHKLEYFLNARTDLVEIDIESISALKKDVPPHVVQKLDNLHNEFKKGDLNLISVAVEEWHLVPNAEEIATVIKEFQKTLMAQIQEVTDFAVSLHMSVVFLFPVAFPGSLIHISGRFVPSIVKTLEPYLCKKKLTEGLDLHTFFKTYQQKILVYLRSQEGAASLEQDLQTLKDRIRNILDF